MALPKKEVEAAAPPESADVATIESKEENEPMPAHHGGAKPDEVATEAGLSFSRSRMIADAIPLTGYEPHIIIGALHGRKDADDHHTVEEIKSLVEEWLATPVKEGV